MPKREQRLDGVWGALCKWGGAQLTPWWPSPALSKHQGLCGSAHTHRVCALRPISVAPVLVLAWPSARKGAGRTGRERVPKDPEGTTLVQVAPGGPWQQPELHAGCRCFSLQ